MRISRREAVMSLAVAAAARGLIYSGSAGAQEGDSVVVCPAGAVRGRRKGALNVYTGIPYGAPTGGAARYRRSVPALRWPGVFDATRTPTVSPQATATPDELLAARGKSAADWPQAVPFKGVLDSRVLPVLPIDAVARGSARDVDLLLGWCRDETRMMVPPQVAGDSAFVPPTFKATAEQMKKARGVYAEADPSLSVADPTYKVTTAETFGMTSLRLTDAQVASGGEVFKYRLDYKVENGPFGDKTPHGFDVPMVFEQFDHRLARLNGFSRADAPMGATMRAVWSSFIRTGVVDAGLPQWPTYDLRQESTMIIDRVPRVERHLEMLDRVAWQGAL
ncbi:carboxylesterase family protein [uncultured Sphingomonas sp.]|uniref:carboxylesterase family protein n=1 Tax=uncultured Sphingomonas sp. TaxID=158754 RepID=UPI0035CA73C7